jgi:hydroxyethylthiazole kinase
MFEEDVSELLARVREKKPIVHHITNYVTVNDCANATLAIGASPIMAHAPEEIEEIIKLASAVVLNIGTLDKNQIETMTLAAEKAREFKKPVILDAVGAGATNLRTKTARNLISRPGLVTIVKGNASEIGALAGVEAKTKGVDEGTVKGTPKEIARMLNKRVGITTVVTGAQDVCVGIGGTYLVNNGTPRMRSITGTGCMAASLIGAFAAIDKNYAFDSAAALSCLCISGELADSEKGQMSFKNKLFDNLSLLDAKTLEERVRIERIA